MEDKNEGLTTFPKELLAEILCKLPVKSLMRFTCVCKTWLSIIMHDPHFAIKQYVARTTSSSNVFDSVDYILSSTSHGRWPCLYSFTAAKTYKYLNKFDCVPDTSIEWAKQANPCHGILCFYLVSQSRVLLCNPLIREVMLLPPCPSKAKYLLLGYDVINDDYKVVTISRGNIFTVNVYSVRQGYWRSLHVSDPLHHRIDCFEGCWELNANGRMHNCLFCDNSDYYRYRVSKGLISFDMVDEVFNFVPMPECEIPKTHEHQLLSSTKWQACLSCVPKCYDFDGRYVDIWVLNNQVWSRVFGVKYPCFEPMQPSGFWLSDKEMLVTVKSTNVEEVFHYDLDTQQLTRTGRCRSTGSGYVGSLISIKHYMTSPKHECEHGNQNVGQDKDSKVDDDNGGFTFRAISRKGVRWLHSF